MMISIEDVCRHIIHVIMNDAPAPCNMSSPSPPIEPGPPPYQINESDSYAVYIVSSNGHEHSPIQITTHESYDAVKAENDTLIMLIKTCMALLIIVVLTSLFFVFITKICEIVYDN